MANRVINDAIGIHGGLDLAEHLVRREIEDRDETVAAIRDETATDACDNGDTVVTLLAGNVGHRLAGNSIENHRVGRAGNVKKSVVGIDGKIVPAARPTDMESLTDLIGANLCRCGRLPVNPGCTRDYQ